MQRRLLGLGSTLTLLSLMLFATTQAGAASLRHRAPLLQSRTSSTVSGTAALGRVPVGGRVAADAPHRAAFVRPAAANAPVRLTVAFKPLNGQLLTELADQSSGKPGLTLAMIRRLVSPPAGLVHQTNRYLSRYGFRHTSGGILTQTYVGTVQAAERAFQTSLGTYQSRGVTFRSPASAPTLPAAIAAHVQTIGGLDTYPLYHPLFAKPPDTASAQPHTAVAASCPGPGNVQSSFGGYLPSDLASAAGYDSQSLIDANHDGRGEVIDMLELANYQAGDNAAYESCFGLSVPISSVTVNGGTSSLSGAGEVELDDQVAASAAPGLDHIYNYVAPNTTGIAAIIDQMLSEAALTHVTEISISWGLCEDAQPFDDVAASDAEFKLAAIAGISVFAASGDDGSEDCQRATGSTDLAVDFPASDPYVTGVGGTTLNLGLTGANREVAWGYPHTGSGGGGGGGLSLLYPTPLWQWGTGVAGPWTSLLCSVPGGQCRSVPDISLDANPDTGHIVYCTAILDCGGGGWGVVGGTSAAAPLMAAITAEANHYSLANAGGRLGFANPFLYAKLGTAAFRDVTLGSNDLSGGLFWSAAAGYDRATGVGSPDAAQFAQALATYTAPAINIHTSSIVAAATRTTITPGKTTTLYGYLYDTTTGLPDGDRRVVIQGYYQYGPGWWVLHRYLTTAGDGSFQMSISTSSVPSQFQWFASFPGTEDVNAALSTWHIVRVLPKLSTTSNLRLRHGHYTVAHNKGFTLSGVSKPALWGKKVSIQYRTAGTRRWHSTTLRATVAKSGSYAKTRLYFARPTRVYLRWHYTGTTSGPWLPANAPAKLFWVT